MRYLYVIICGLGSALGARAQAPAATGQLAPDSVWYEAPADTRRVRSATDSVGACTEVLRWEGPGGLVRIFYPSGHLQEYSTYGDLATGTREGAASTWFDSGQLHTQQAYAHGRRTGPLLVYYESGQLKRRTEYVAGNELPGSCFEEAGAPVAYFPYEQPPLYPGGYAQLSKEIGRALRLTRQMTASLTWEAQLTRQPHVVGVEFQVSEDGRIRAPRVARSSPVPGLDAAVLATLARLTKRFSPGRRDGRLVAYTYYLPVQLRMPIALRSIEKP
ncbi:energy transducer TonB [Hymenobacter cheonanensis]|uniref:energy transducer TonB n=1 Tax=Hymenobacter sp. CA2-7 TaxID=3063993 RepID=UPI002712C3AB|nr:energy transducer TonB [Hymenobacter sp. CA2-7]MDO7886229.1 TonB family protein [Hymenobacter sp. CA2-7]